MKKGFMVKLLLTIAFCLMLGATVFAGEPTKQITLDEFDVGGISVGSSLDNVVAKYGLPTKQGSFNYNRLIKGMIYHYGDLLTIEAIPKSDGGTSVIGVVCKNPKLATPSGFAVGRSYKEVVARYGVVPNAAKGKLSGNERWLGMARGYTFYDYYAGPFCMRFNVDDKGIIKTIAYEAYE
jgi:hypothetical protein